MKPIQPFGPLDAATDAALRASIERFGVIVPIVRDQNGRIIDGHNRARIASELGVTYAEDIHAVADDDEAIELARTLNQDRRQMPPGQRREVVTALREQGHSIRAIAGAVGASKSQVAKDVAQLSTGGQLAVPDRVVGEDGKSRPATRRPPVEATAEAQQTKPARGRSRLKRRAKNPAPNFARHATFFLRRATPGDLWYVRALDTEVHAAIDRLSAEPLDDQGG